METNPTTTAPVYPELNNARKVEAHMLDAHRHDVCLMPRDVRSLAWLRDRHAELHADGQMLFPHDHDPADLPVPSGAIDAGMLGR